MDRRHSSIIHCLTEKIAEIIEWGCTAYSLPILIIETKWSFDKRKTISRIKGRCLKFEAFFSLYEFMSTWETGGEFYESFKRVKDDPIIGTFSGTGPELLIALVCHEMAHVFEQVASQEKYFPGKVLSYYGLPCITDTRHHHNELWRTIYRELKTKFMPSVPKCEIQSMIDIVRVKNLIGIDFYAKKVLDNLV